MGQYMDKNTEFSILNVDKPSGPTSFSVSMHIKNIIGVTKASHLGTLDPGVTGVLPIALGRACRISGYLLGSNKRYTGIMRLHDDVSDEDVKKAVSRVIGKIKQVPPVRSRVKRKERTREIMSFKVLEREGKDILFDTQVQGGTYIRKLIHDIGKGIGGAHMLELRRTEAGIFDEKEAIDLYEIQKAAEEYKNGEYKRLKAMLIPAEEVIKRIFPIIQVKDDLVGQLLSGRPLHEGEADAGYERFAVFSGRRFVGIYRKVKEGKMIARPEFVLD